ncbi:MAG: V-type ATP synthase subunit D, partial [Verrucomicrobia bacterium]|nr:V-type ATP synthase subunit D [Verrucomicrobiota bacterium]
MAKLSLAPTKSNLLSLKRQLAFAEEGYDLLEQKRQILIFELMSRLTRASDVETRVAEAAQLAFAALRQAELAVGSEALERAALGVRLEHQVRLGVQRLMGMRLLQATVQTEPVTAQLGVSGTSVHADLAMRRFVEALPALAELAELETAVRRLA